MKIVLATGIYPPDIGGPATYVRHLAEELSQRGEEVIVLTYGMKNEELRMKNSWKVIHVAKTGGPLLRWRRYAQALKEHASDADVVECFSSVSAGMPLGMARLKKPKKILRLGGDFTWERYTDLGGRMRLREFLLKQRALRLPMARLLRSFDHIVFSTQFQERLYERGYRMGSHSVIENALAGDGGTLGQMVHVKHDPLKLLYLGRFVRFKNLENLLHSVANIPHASLTLVGEGPLGLKLSALGRTLQMQGRVQTLPPVHGEDIRRVFDDHDLLVLPSLTEISPNAALEARAAGLPVLLTEENGLSDELRGGMIVRPLITKGEITKAILDVDQRYEEYAQAAAGPFTRERSWEVVAAEHVELFRRLLS